VAQSSSRSPHTAQVAGFWAGARVEVAEQLADLGTCTLVLQVEAEEKAHFAVIALGGGVNENGLFVVAGVGREMRRVAKGEVGLAFDWHARLGDLVPDEYSGAAGSRRPDIREVTSIEDQRVRSIPDPAGLPSSCAARIGWTGLG
jgi:hypothetical protein